MISDEAAAKIRDKITAQTHNVSYYDPTGLEILQTPGTSHIAVADRSGMAISLTTTVNLLFGSTVIVPETGVIMNDEMNGRIAGSSMCSLIHLLIFRRFKISLFQILQTPLAISHHRTTTLSQVRDHCPQSRRRSSKTRPASCTTLSDQQEGLASSQQQCRIYGTSWTGTLQLLKLLSSRGCTTSWSRTSLSSSMPTITRRLHSSRIRASMSPGPLRVIAPRKRCAYCPMGPLRLPVSQGKRTLVVSRYELLLLPGCIYKRLVAR